MYSRRELLLGLVHNADNCRIVASKFGTSGETLYRKIIKTHKQASTPQASRYRSSSSSLSSSAVIIPKQFV
jgi:transposase